MHSREVQSSLTPILESVNGGKLDLAKDTSSIESESSIEETAVVQDLEEPRSMLITNFVEPSQWEPKMANGIMLSAQDHFSVQRLDL
jgi:hypothetical protein